MLSRLIKLVGPVALLAALFILGSFLHPAKAAAATCTFNGQYVNAEIWVEIVTSNGSHVAWSNDFKFNVNAAANKAGNPSPNANYPSQYWPQNDTASAIRTPGGSPVGPGQAVNASGNTHSCPTAPGGPSAPAYDFTDGSNGNYLLDCLGGDTHGVVNGPIRSGYDGQLYNNNTTWANPQYSARFTFTVTDPGAGYSFNDGVVQGGPKTWAPSTTADLNYAGPLAHVFKFVLNDWTLAGTSTETPSPVNSKTQVASFTHNVVNNGPDPANWKWRIEGCYQPAGQPACVSTDYGPNINGGGGGAIGSGSEGSPTGVAKGGNGSLPKVINYQFSFKSGSAAGDRYCQRIAFDDKNGPNTTPNYGAHSTPACVTYQPSNAPSGSITPACDPGNATAHATASFNDADGSATYPLTGKLSSGVMVQSATVNATSGTVTLNSAPVVNGSATFILTVKDVGPGATTTFTTSASVSCAGGSSCPSLPNSQIAVSLPDQAPTTPAPVGATNTPNQTYEQDTRQSKTKVTSITDKSPGIWGGSSTPPTQVSETYQQVVLDYRPYIDNYSYDNNQPSVAYDSYYNATYWYTSSSPNYYTCPSGGSVSGSNCVYGAYSYYSCPFGGFLSGSTCYTYVGNATYNSTTFTYTCSSGSYVFGACYTTRSATLNYYCSPGSLSGTTCTYGATAWYSWNRGSTSFNLTRNNTVDGQQMTPCYQRQFTVTSVTGDQTNLNDNENPSTVTGGGGTINVTFNYDGAHTPARGLRQRFQVNLNYNTTYTINGVTPYMVGCSSTSGGVTVTDGFSAPGSGTASVPNSSCSARVPPLQAGDKVCGQYDVSPTGQYMAIDGTVIPPGGNGTPITDSSCSGAVVNEPYARFYGSDVTAGGAFASGSNQCAGSPMHLGSINSYQRGVGPRPQGSGSQFAALSLGQIQSFASAFLRSLAPTSTTGLSFANTPAAGPFGGNLGATYQHCVPDYYGTLPADNSAWAGSFAAPGGAYTYSGDLTLGPGTVAAGTNLSIYVNGDVYISGDLTYQTNGWTVTGNTSNVPSLYIIATGSINISPGVHTLDGVYVAQNNTIHTCAAGPGTANLYDATDLYNNCHSRLRINGSFIANNIVLDRTYSSLRHSQGGENPFGGSPLHPCDVSGGVLIDLQADCSAEIFNMGLETYLSSPAMAPSGGPKSGKFDAITSLSPVL